jgi:hypothetical protein
MGIYYSVTLQQKGLMQSENPETVLRIPFQMYLKHICIKNDIFIRDFHF